MIGVEFRMYYDLGSRGYCILYYYIILLLYYTLLWNDFRLIDIISLTDVVQLSLTLKMTTAQIVETSVTDTPRYSLCSIRKNVKVYQHLLCNRRFIQYARIPACWINCPFYKIRAKVIFHRCCYLRYRLLMSPYSWGLHDLRVQCVAVLSIYSLTLVLSRLWWNHDVKFVTMPCPLNVGLSIASM